MKMKKSTKLIINCLILAGVMMAIVLTVLTIVTVGSLHSSKNQMDLFRGDPSLHFVTQCSSGGSGDEQETRIYCTCVKEMAAEVSDDFHNEIAESDASNIVNQCLTITSVWATWKKAKDESRPLPLLED